MAGAAKLMKNRLYVLTYLYSVVDVFFLLANSVRCRRSIMLSLMSAWTGTVCKVLSIRSLGRARLYMRIKSEGR